MGVVLVAQLECSAYLLGCVVANEHAKPVVILRSDVSQDRGRGIGR